MIAATPDALQPPAPQRKGCLLRGLTWCYLAALLLAWLVTRWVAERTPATTLLLYAPQALYGAPVLPLLLWAVWRRDRAALLALGMAAGVVGGPLMGLCL